MWWATFCSMKQVNPLRTSGVNFSMEVIDLLVPGGKRNRRGLLHFPLNSWPFLKHAPQTFSVAFPVNPKETTHLIRLQCLCPHQNLGLSFPTRAAPDDPHANATFMVQLPGRCPGDSPPQVEERIGCLTLQDSWTSEVQESW